MNELSSKNFNFSMNKLRMDVTITLKYVGNNNDKIIFIKLVQIKYIRMAGRLFAYFLFIFYQFLL